MVANEHKVFPKKINDPLFSIVKQFFKQRHEIVNEQGNIVDRHLADTRYSDLKPEDFMIESVYTDDDGSKKICLVKRDKSFARVDIPVSTVNLLTIAKDFNREVVVSNNHCLPSPKRQFFNYLRQLPPYHFNCKTFSES